MLPKMNYVMYVLQCYVDVIGRSTNNRAISVNVNRSSCCCAWFSLCMYACTDTAMYVNRAVFVSCQRLNTTTTSRLN